MKISSWLAREEPIKLKIDTPKVRSKSLLAEEPNYDSLSPEERNLVRWRESGQAWDWVQERKGTWNHDDWLLLLERLKRSSFWPMNPDAVGQVLESLKRLWYEKEQQLIFTLRGPGLEAPMKAAKQLGESGSVDALYKLLHDSDRKIRGLAAYGLLYHPTSQVAEMLTEALIQEQDEYARKGIASSLKCCAYAPAVGRTVQVIKSYIEQFSARKSEEEGSWSDTDTSMDLIKFLENTLHKVAGEVSVIDLQAIMSLEPSPTFIFVYVTSCDTNRNKMVLDCHQIRQLARQELNRRGLEA